MTKRQHLIKQLLTTFHLNKVDRQEFKNRPINIKEIIDIIQLELQDNNIFPKSASVWKIGRSVFEGYFLEKIADTKYKLHWQRHQAINPLQLAERTELDYSDFNKLVEDYIRREYNYSIGGLEIGR